MSKKLQVQMVSDNATSTMIPSTDSFIIYMYILIQEGMAR